MSVDFYLKPDDPEKKLTREEISKNLEGKFRIFDIGLDADGFVSDFKLEQLNESIPEKLIFEFHRQDDGRWWHPVVAVSDEAFGFEQEVIGEVCVELGMEQDFSDLENLL